MYLELSERRVKCGMPRGSGVAVGIVDVDAPGGRTEQRVVVRMDGGEKANVPLSSLELLDDGGKDFDLEAVLCVGLAGEAKSYLVRWRATLMTLAEIERWKSEGYGHVQIGAQVPEGSAWPRAVRWHDSWEREVSEEAIAAYRSAIAPPPSSPSSHEQATRERRRAPPPGVNGGVDSSVDSDDDDDADDDAEPVEVSAEDFATAVSKSHKRRKLSEPAPAAATSAPLTSTSPASAAPPAQPAQPKRPGADAPTAAPSPPTPSPSRRTPGLSFSGPHRCAIAAACTVYGEHLEFCIGVDPFALPPSVPSLLGPNPTSGHAWTFLSFMEERAGKKPLPQLIRELAAGQTVAGIIDGFPVLEASDIEHRAHNHARCEGSRRGSKVVVRKGHGRLGSVVGAAHGAPRLAIEITLPSDGTPQRMVLELCAADTTKKPRRARQGTAVRRAVCARLLEGSPGLGPSLAAEAEAALVVCRQTDVYEDREAARRWV